MMARPQAVHKAQLKMWLGEVGMNQKFYALERQIWSVRKAGDGINTRDDAKRKAFKAIFGVELPGMGNQLYAELKRIAPKRQGMLEAINGNAGRVVIVPHQHRHTSDGLGDDLSITDSDDEHAGASEQPMEAADLPDNPPPPVRPSESVPSPVDVVYRDVLEWVATNLSTPGITLNSALSPLAYELWVTYSPVNMRSMFFEKLYHKAANLDEDGERDAKADDRVQLDRLEGMGRKILALVKEERQRLEAG